MDLQALKALQNARQSDHLHARHKKSEKLYKLGVEYFQRARQQEMDRELLKKAAKCFTAAIENNRSDARAYIQQAYLFLLVRNGRKAVKYLQEAQRLDPENARVKELMGHIRNDGSLKSSRSVAQRSNVSATDAMGHRLQKVAKELEQLLAKAYRELQALQPTWAKPVWQGYCRLQQEYDTAYQRLCDRLDQIGKHVETSELDAQLQTLEISLNRLDDVCELSEQMVTLYQRIQHSTKTLQGHLEESHKSLAARSQIPGLLDKYQKVLDTLADDLDMMEGSGFNIAALMGPYEVLIGVFQQLDQIGQGA